MPKALPATTLVATLLLVTTTALAHSFAGPDLARFAPVLELDGTGSAPLARTPPARGLDLRAQAPDDAAPPPLAAPREGTDDDGFQGYFDRHYRAHAANDGEAHRYFQVE